MAATAQPLPPPGDGDDPSLAFGALPGLVGYHLRRAQLALFRRFAQEVTAAEGVTPGVFGLLQLIGANPGLSQSRLAEAMEVDRSAVVRVLDQMERRGLIERAAAEDDRRRYCLRLTETGEAALRRIEAAVVEHEERFLAPLSARERTTLVALLMRLHAGRDHGGKDHGGKDR